jgi:putative ABC transport system permease protein
MESGFVNYFILLKKGASRQQAEQMMTELSRSAAPSNASDNVVLQPFANLHLAPGFNYPFQTYGSLGLVTMLLSIALLILLIAWVNYINLSTVQALKRAREAGVRKVLGASKGQIALQFLRETFIITLIALAFAVLLTQLFQPLFNSFTGKKLSLASLNAGWFWLGAMALILAGTLMSGGYVSFVLSSFKPVNILKGQSQGMVKGNLLRKGMVVFQFVVSIVFIVATIVLFKQLSFMKTGSLGFSMDQLVVISGPTVSSDDQANRNKTFKTQLAALPFVEKVSGSNNIPGRGYNFQANGITRPNPMPGDEQKSYNMFIADQQFFSVYSIPFVAGRSFTEAEADASWNNDQKVILNEKAARELGFSPVTSAVGQKVLWGKPFEVIGVVKDYHHLSKHKPIEPVIYLGSVSYSNFTVKTSTANLQSKLDKFQQMYKAIFPGNPWEYFFADEAYEQQYRAEQDLGKIFIAAALVAIFIACLGLFGLAAFAAQQRVKEIGVRKVLGASVTNITAMLSGDFVKLVLVAIVIATPLAWWGMHRWLQDFAYRTDVAWWIFVVAGLAAIFIALSTVSLQAIRAAKQNPVKALRSE